MKRLFSFVLMLQLASVCFSQSMTIIFKDGTTVKHKMNLIESIEFTDDDDGISQVYDILQINGDKYACYGYRCFITYSSSWDLETNEGEILLPCGKLSDAEKGEYDYDYMFAIYLEGKERLKKGSKIEDYFIGFSSTEDIYEYEYASGSAIVSDIISDEYITISFKSFEVRSDDGNSYVLDGTVQLDFDED